MEVAGKCARTQFYSGAWGERASYLLVRSRIPGWGAVDPVLGKRSDTTTQR